MSWADLPPHADWVHYSTEGEGAAILRGVGVERERLRRCRRDPIPRVFTRRLLIENLPIDFSLTELVFEFGCYGPIQHVLILNRASRILQYESVADAEAAWWQESSGRLTVRGHTVRVTVLQEGPVP